MFRLIVRNMSLVKHCLKSFECYPMNNIRLVQSFHTSPYFNSKCKDDLNVDEINVYASSQGKGGDDDGEDGDGDGDMSTEDIPHGRVKTPIVVFGLDGRYAMATYSAARRRKELLRVEKDFVRLAKDAQKGTAFRAYMANPTERRKKKAAEVHKLALQVKMCRTTANLLSTMAINGRLKLLLGVIKHFQSLMNAYRGTVHCEVRIAMPINNDQIAHLQNIIKEFLKPGETPVIIYKIRPKIIGGIILVIGDKYVDMSTASKIEKYSRLCHRPVKFKVV